MQINDNVPNGARQLVISLLPDGQLNLAVSPTIPPELAMALLEIVHRMMAEQVLRAHTSPIITAGGVIPRND
jgi:hypothetical protein